MRKFVVYGILLFWLHHVVRPVIHGAKKAAHIAYRVAV
jgi:hypothetical protein